MIESITLINNELNKNILINKTDSPYILDEADLGVIESSHNSSKYYNQIGESLMSSTLGTRVISISGWIIGDSELAIQNRKKEINVLVNPLQDIVLTYDIYQITMRAKNTIKYSTNYSENNEVMCKFLISAICYNPLFEDIATTTTAVTNNVILINGGTIETGIKIVISAAGVVKNPKVSLSNGDFIILNKTLSSGEEITINTGYGKEKITGKIGTNEFNYYRYFDYDSTWLKLKLGNNTLSVTAEENASMLSASISYTNKYLEVQ